MIKGVAPFFGILWKTLICVYIRVIFKNEQLSVGIQDCLVGGGGYMFIGGVKGEVDWGFGWCKYPPKDRGPGKFLTYTVQ